MKNLRSDYVKTLEMFPNGKRPLSSQDHWKPSDGYIEEGWIPTPVKILVQRAAMVVILVAIAGALVVVATIAK